MDGAGPRGFCAGGDIRGLYDAAKAGDPVPAEAFFRNEYVLNAAIANYPKPVIVLMDGITMGGGIGLGSHASHRIVTERSMLAMPEVCIGFYPDVGGTFLLGTAPGELGTHLAMTGERFEGSDAIACNLADRMVASPDLVKIPDLLRNVGTGDAVWPALESVMITPKESAIVAAKSWIDQCYGMSAVEDILAALETLGTTAALEARAKIQKNCPTSLKVTLRALRQARNLGRLEPCLEQEFQISRKMVMTPNFLEGVRAAVVDKDRNPSWSPPRLEDVTAESVECYFQDSAAAGLIMGAAP